MNKLPKVLFLIPSVSSGGIETYLLRFLTLKKSEVNAFILVRGNKEGDLSAEYEALGVPMFFIPLGYFKPAKWVVYFQFFKRNNFDVVCDFNANFAGIPLLLAKLAGIRKRIAFYRQGKDHFKQTLIRRYYNQLMNRLVFRYATHILANSQAAIDFFFHYRSVVDNRFQVVYNGVEKIQFQHLNSARQTNRKSINVPEDAYVIGHSGRLDKAKNHTTILMVAQQLIQQDPNTYLVLCGRNTEKLSKKVEALGISNNVRLLGYRADIPAVLQSFDLFFFPSITEGQPNALIEAILSGLQIVASNIAPIKEITPEAFHDFLLDANDNEGFTELINKIKNGEIQQNTPELKEWAEMKFDAEKNFTKFMEVICSE